MYANYLTTCVKPKILMLVTSNLANKINADKNELMLTGLAVRGVSGLVVGGIVSTLTGLPLIIVRKGEQRHSDYGVEYDGHISNYAVVDDLIGTGATVRTIRDTIKESIPLASLVKVYLYYHKGDWAHDCVRWTNESHIPIYSCYPNMGGNGQWEIKENGQTQAYRAH